MICHTGANHSAPGIRNGKGNTIYFPIRRSLENFQIRQHVVIHKGQYVVPGLKGNDLGFLIGGVVGRNLLRHPQGCPHGKTRNRNFAIRIRCIGSHILIAAAGNQLFHGKGNPRYLPIVRGFVNLQGQQPVIHKGQGVGSRLEGNLLALNLRLVALRHGFRHPVFRAHRQIGDAAFAAAVRGVRPNPAIADARHRLLQGEGNAGDVAIV